MDFDKTELEAFGLKVLCDFAYAKIDVSHWIFSKVVAVEKGREALGCFLNCLGKCLRDNNRTDVEMPKDEIALMGNVFGKAILGQGDRLPSEISDWIDQLIIKNRQEAKDCQGEQMEELNNRACKIWEQYKATSAGKATQEAP